MESPHLGSLRGQLNLDASQLTMKADIRMVYDKQTKHITVEVITPPQVDVTLTANDYVPPQA
jgi:hypothetical protein